MTTEKLSLVFQDWFCGCGAPWKAAGFVRERLAAIAAHVRPDYNPDGLYYFIMYTLDEKELIEHGTSITGSFLTDKGRAVLAALNREYNKDGFETLFQSRCVHGYTFDDERHPVCE